MPGEDGLQMISELREIMPELIIIILTGYDQFDYASKAIKLSVFDYILKPIQNDEVEDTISKAIEVIDKKQRNNEIIAEVDRLQTRARLLSLLTNMSHAGQNVLTMMRKPGWTVPSIS